MARHAGLFKRGGIWHLRTDPFTGRQLSTHCHAEKAALMFRAERERLAASPTNAAALRATLGEWIAKVLAAKKADKKADGTLNAYRKKLGHFLRVWSADLPLARITPDLVDEYVAQRRSEWVTRERHVTDHTIVKEISCLVQLLKHAKRRGSYAGDITAIRPLDLHPGYKPRQRLSALRK